MDFPIENADFPVRYVSHYQRVAWVDASPTSPKSAPKKWGLGPCLLPFLWGDQLLAGAGAARCSGEFLVAG